MFEAIHKSSERLLGILLVICFVVLVVDVVLGVFWRYVLSSPIGWTEELATFLMVWLVFLGSTYAYLLNSHLDPDVKRLINVFAHTLVLLFSIGVFVYGGVILFIERLFTGQLMPTLGIRKAWFYLSVPVSGVLFIVFSLGKVLIYKEEEKES